MRQDQHMFDEFGIGVVGIGALFFAYGTITTASVKLIIALIGLGGSLIIWDHMYGTRQHYYKIREIVTSHNPEFGKFLVEADKWRDSGIISRWFYQPASRMKIYFMALVSWAWGTIILYRIGAIAHRAFTNPFVIPEEYYLNFIVIFWSSMIVFLAVILLILSRKFQDRCKHG